MRRRGSVKENVFPVSGEGAPSYAIFPRTKTGTGFNRPRGSPIQGLPYACAKLARVPLLYKCNDFAQTDLA
jgi:hypothetical protein